MTKLMQFINDNNVTFYALTKKMGKKIGNYYRLKQQINGEVPVKIEILKEAEEALKQLTGKELNFKLEDSYEVNTVYCK